jgi:phage baseplate assembly protein W
MAIQRISRSFRDISLSFIPHPITNDLTILRNENAIVRSVRNLVETIPRERFFNSTIGSNVRSSLFDFVDFGSAANIKNQIETVIQNYEPRIDNLIVEVDPKPDDNTFEVTLIFDIVGQDFPTQTINFILEATR